MVDRLPLPGYLKEYADLLTSLGRDDEAEQQRELITAQQQILEAAGVDLDSELALYAADAGDAEASLQAAERAFSKRKGIFTEDAYAWALHVNGRDRDALPHIRRAQPTRHEECTACLPPGSHRSRPSARMPPRPSRMHARWTSTPTSHPCRRLSRGRR
ncbi:MAG: hypothetical protein WKF73_20855 [Nocardioidaceae bacterium]